MDKTLQSINLLKQVQTQVKEELGADYEKTIQPFVLIIEKVMTANGINEFDAMASIKSTLDLYKRKNGPPFFSAALVEIVEAKYFKGFRK